MKPIVFDGKLYSPCECALARPMAEQIARLRAEVETLKRERDEADRLAVSRLDFANESFRKSAEYAVKLDMLTHEHKLAIAEADRYRAALEEIVDRATIETAPAATIARKALEGDAK